MHGNDIQRLVATRQVWVDEVIDEEKLLQLIEGRAILRGISAGPMRLDRTLRLLFDEAANRRPQFCVGPEHALALWNAWWSYCELKKQPYVGVKLRRKYASFTVDMLTVDARLTVRESDRLLDLWQQTTKHHKTTVSCGAEGFDVWHIPCDNAVQLAGKVWEVLGNIPCAVELSSGNVFADLGLPNAEERLKKAEMVIECYRLDRSRSMASLRRLSTEDLIALLARLREDSQCGR